jgi:hypothetical protein
MRDNLKPVPSLTCQHLHLTEVQLATLKPSLRLAEKNSKRPPRSLADFQRQYARIHAQQLGTMPR